MPAKTVVAYIVKQREPLRGPSAKYTTLAYYRNPLCIFVYQTLNHYTAFFSLPTPQPAGSRPTVMTIFPPTSAVRNMTYTHGGATIHTSHPDKKRHVRAIFGDQGGNSMVKTRSVSGG